MTKQKRINEFNEKSSNVEIRTVVSEFLNTNKYIYVEGGILDDEDYHRLLCRNCKKDTGKIVIIKECN